jgi:molybdenum cofactor cytidylyltransferase
MNSGSPPVSLGVAILAAGSSQRMSQPKLLLPWKKTTIIGHLLQVWQDLATQVTVVCAENDSAMAAELDRLAFPESQRVWNPDPARGMFSSIQCAARWNAWRPGLTHCAIALGDQPLILPDTLRRLIAFAGEHSDQICQPRRNDRPRHPVIVPAFIWREVAQSDATMLRDFLQARAVQTKLLDLDDPGLDLDLDTPSDYARATLFQGAWPPPPRTGH